MSGSTPALTAEVFNAFGQLIDTASVSWSSSVDTVAVIDADAGSVTTLAPDTTTLAATAAEGVTAELGMRVYDDAPDSVASRASTTLFGRRSKA